MTSDGVGEAPPRRRGRPPAVSRDDIVEASLRLIDRDGLEAFSLRRLADELGVANMTIYNHVGDRNELLHLVVDRVYRDVKTDDLAERPAIDAIEQHSLRISEAFLAHPQVCPLLALPVSIYGAQGARVLDAKFEALSRAGLEPSKALEVYWLLVTVQLGHLVGQQVGTERVLVDDLTDAMAAALAASPEASFPHLAEAIAAAPQAERTDRFTWALRVVLAGLEKVGLPEDSKAKRRPRRASLGD